MKRWRTVTGFTLTHIPVSVKRSGSATTTARELYKIQPGELPAAFVVAPADVPAGE